MADTHVCTGCVERIVQGNVVIGEGDRAWHPACFVCAKCGRQINVDSETGYLGTVPVQCSYSDDAEKLDPVQRLRPCCGACVAESAQCSKCRERIILGDKISFDSATFHPVCFVCVSCSKNLDGEEVTEVAGSMVCKSCFQSKFSIPRF